MWLNIILLWRQKNVNFFEHIFPLKVNDTVEQPIDNNSDTICEGLRSKRKRKEISFGDDFYTYLVENDPTSF